MTFDIWHLTIDIYWDLTRSTHYWDIARSIEISQDLTKSTEISQYLLRSHKIYRDLKRSTDLAFYILHLLFDIWHLTCHDIWHLTFNIWHLISEVLLFYVWHFTFDIDMPCLILMILAQSYLIITDGFCGYLSNLSLISQSVGRSQFGSNRC